MAKKIIIVKPVGDERQRVRVSKSVQKMADKDPDFIENMKAGRYMPTCNGRRVVYRGKDKWLGIKMELLGILFSWPFWLLMVMVLVLIFGI